MTAPSPAGEPDPRLVALGREVERLARRHSDLDQRQTDLDTLVRCLAEDLALLLPPGGDEDPPALPSWLAAADPVQARAMLTDLAEWLGAVYLRYPDAVLPSCWAWHPAAVEELWWLRNAHRAAYDTEGVSWRDVADWHDRQRPGVARRLHAALGACDLARHTPGGDRHQPPPTAPLAAHLGPLAERWTTHHDTPDPTAQQLTDAAAHDYTHRRTRR